MIDYRVHQVSLGGRRLDHLVHLGHLLIYLHQSDVHLVHLAHRDLQDYLATVIGHQLR